MPLCFGAETFGVLESVAAMMLSRCFTSKKSRSCLFLVLGEEYATAEARSCTVSLWKKRRGTESLRKTRRARNENPRVLEADGGGELPLRQRRFATPHVVELPPQSTLSS